MVRIAHQLEPMMQQWLLTLVTHASPCPPTSSRSTRNTICLLQGLFELAAKTYKPKQRVRRGGKRRAAVTGTIDFLDAPPSESAAALQLQVQMMSECWFQM